MDIQSLVLRDEDIQIVIDIAKEAGREIMKIYNYAHNDWDIELKKDDSPLTLADRRSHEVIECKLAAHFPEIPILSEEGKDIPYSVRKDWRCYWCVDPLDGTKEFIAKNGEFTVNIALMVNNEPVLGVIYVPVQDVVYYGQKGKGSYKAKNGTTTAIRCLKKTRSLVAVGSKSHRSGQEDQYLSQLDVKEVVSVGSSLKFCLVAEGKAQIYYRYGPTMEWDTAAGHAIALHSGATISQPNGDAFVYNKPDLLNSSFICSA
jgi:3'(2'), 5'-bisphosphate nucleotidase